MSFASHARPIELAVEKNRQLLIMLTFFFTYGTSIMPLAKTQIDTYAHVFISPTKIEIAIESRR